MKARAIACMIAAVTAGAQAADIDRQVDLAVENMAVAVMIAEYCGRLKVHRETFNALMGGFGITAARIDSGGDLHRKFISAVQAAKGELSGKSEEVICMVGDRLFGIAGEAPGVLVPD